MNEGQVLLNMEAPRGNGSTVPVHSSFQVTEVKTPLMSVGKVCDSGSVCIFTKDGAEILNAEDGQRLLALHRKPMCTFTRKPKGLYVADMKLKPPAHFPRQAP